MEKLERIQKIPPDTEAVIDEAVQRAMKAFKESLKGTKDQKKSKNALTKTENRLSAMPILRTRIKDDKDRMKQLQTIGSPERSKSIIRYSRQSSRIKPEDALDAMIKELHSNIATDSYELETMEKALSIIKKDPYYYTVKGKYEEGLDNDTIAQTIGCDVTTVWRNRQRLMKQLAIRLYGTEAMD